MKNRYFTRFAAYLRVLTSVTDDVDTVQAAESIKKNLYFKGPNVYILAIAVVIASVGLNVNSIPVIIGAMLVSPLMGPLFGFALGFGTNDVHVLLDSLKNLAAMVVISIISATLYFLLTPLDLQHPTELLARTNPTFYDVLIAFFGGLAGVFETTRKEKGTVLSGVAIATALMPPLCTVGFGIATGQWMYALGALYLFFINGTFITLAGIIVVKYLRFEVKTGEKHGRRWFYVLMLLIFIVPSVFSAIRLIQDNNRDREAAAFIDAHRTLEKSFIYDSKIITEGRVFHRKTEVELYYAGEVLSDENKIKLISDGAALGFQVKIFDQATSESITESDVVTMIMEQSSKQLSDKDKIIELLQWRLNAYKDSLETERAVHAGNE